MLYCSVRYKSYVGINTFFSYVIRTIIQTRDIGKLIRSSNYCKIIII